MVAIIDNSQRGLKGGKRIVGYLGTGTGDRRQQGGLARIGESHQSDICQKFQLHDNSHLLHRLAWLCITGSLVGRSAELEVSQSSTTTFQQQHLLSIVCNVAHVLSCFGVIYHGSTRHINIDVLAIGSMTLVSSTIASMFGKEVTLVL